MGVGKRDNMALTGQDMGDSSECKRKSMPPTVQFRKTNSRHNDCDKQPDFTALTDESSTTSESLGHDIMEMR